MFRGGPENEVLISGYGVDERQMARVCIEAAGFPPESWIGIFENRNLGYGCNFSVFFVFHPDSLTDRVRSVIPPPDIMGQRDGFEKRETWGSLWLETRPSEMYRITVSPRVDLTIFAQAEELAKDIYRRSWRGRLDQVWLSTRWAVNDLGLALPKISQVKQ